MLRTKFVRMTAVLLLATLAGACGGSDSSTTPSSGETSGGTSTSSEPPALGGSSAQEYAAAVCTALGEWGASIQTQAQDLANVGSDPLAAMDAMVANLDAITAETDGLIDTINALGAPDAEGGEAAHAALIGALTALRDFYQGLSDGFADVDPNDPAAFAQALSELQTGFTGSNDLTSSLDALKDTEIAQAFQDEPACTSAGIS